MKHVVIVAASLTFVATASVAFGQTSPDPTPEPARTGVVLAGESPGQVAARYDVTLAELRQHNPWLRDPAWLNEELFLWPGDRLLLPATSGDGKPPPVTTGTPTTTSSVPPTTAAPTTSTTSTVPPPPTTEPPASAWTETFDTPASLDRLVFELSDGRPFGEFGRTFPADHALPAGGDPLGDCGNPNTTSRTVSSPGGRTPGVTRFADAEVRDSGIVYWCTNGAQHMMTAYDTGGYAHLDFRPDRTFNDVTRVCWDQNITDMGGKWTQLAIVPNGHFVANDARMDYTDPRRNGSGQPGSWGLPITNGTFLLTLDGRSATSNDQGLNIGTTPREITEDRAFRASHCVEQTSPTEVTITIETSDGGETNETLPGVMPAGEVVVIFQDVSYNPRKRTGNDDEFSWHWDNLLIE